MCLQLSQSGRARRRYSAPAHGGTELEPDCRDEDSRFASPSASITVDIHSPLIALSVQELAAKTVFQVVIHPRSAIHRLLSDL